MRERVSGLLEDANLDSPPNISTFHSFLRAMLRRDGDPLARIRPGFTRRFSIYDDEDPARHRQGTYAGLGWTKKTSCSTARALSRISHAEPEETPKDF